ncbi:MAG: gamma-glutamyl-gamma-aminobutyrate hydrolase family protein [Deltaproteobacteria bacterium]|nr:gamma-glutamyl-gamma-aminobutyrate hydrolase family protein [Deltaproteobacteria bacterium]
MRPLKIIGIIAAIAVILIGGFGIWFVKVDQVPVRVITSMFWEPDTAVEHSDTIVAIEMGSNEDFPLLWKSVGSFLEEHVQARVEIIHYRQTTPAKIQTINPKAVVLTGYHQPLETYKLDEMQGLFDFLTTTNLPVLGICGGHQFIGKAYGKEIVPLGMEEKGFIATALLKDDPIFKGLNSPIKVYYWHKLQVEAIPDDFILLSNNENCSIEAMRHKTRPIYGVQFHPEFSTDEFKDGLQIFLNFAEVAGIEPRKLH